MQGITAVHAGDNISTVGDNINTVEGIQNNEGRFLILACLAIKNDENISMFTQIHNRIGRKHSHQNKEKKILS